MALSQGNRVPATLIQGKFGPCWALLDKPFGRFVGEFIPCSEVYAELFAGCHEKPEHRCESLPDLGRKAKRLRDRRKSDGG